MPYVIALWRLFYDYGVFDPAISGPLSDFPILGVRLPTFNGSKRLRMEHGIIALVGPNGSGKSLALAGIEEALTGTPASDDRLQKAIERTARRYDSDAWELDPLAKPMILSERESERPLVYWQDSFDPSIKYPGMGDEELAAELITDAAGTEELVLSLLDTYSEKYLEEKPFSLNDFIESPYRTYRIVNGQERLGFCIPWHFPPIPAALDELRDLVAEFREVLEYKPEGGFAPASGYGFWYHPLSYLGQASWVIEEIDRWADDYFHGWGPIDDDLSFEETVQLEESGRQHLIEAFSRFPDEAFDNLIYRNFNWGWTDEGPFLEAVDLVEGQVPEWAPLIGFEIPINEAVREKVFGNRFTTHEIRAGGPIRPFKVLRAEFEVNWSGIRDQISTAIMQEVDKRLAYDVDEKDQKRDQEFEECIEEYKTTANQIFQSFMTNQEPITIWSSIELWLTERRNKVLGNIDSASDTTQRWAAVALQLALHEFGYTSRLPHEPKGAFSGPLPSGYDVAESEVPFSMETVLLVDEPERGLGQAAQEHLTRGLAALTTNGTATVVLATHAAAMISHPEIRVVALPNFRELPNLMRDELETLGFGASELLAFYKHTILVEGHHEELVLNELIGDELAARRARILPYRGTKNLSPAVLDDLYAYSQSNFILTADRTRTDLFNNALEIARTAPNTAAGKEHLEGALVDLSEEEKTLKSLFFKILGTRSAERVTAVVGLDGDDILDCLPVEAFTDAGTWSELRQAHIEARDNKVRNTPNDFKAWLTQKHKVDFSDANILAAVSQLDALPDFVAELLDATTEE